MPEKNKSVIYDSTLESIDPHGHAALLLVESLLHGLCEKSLLTTAEAIEIVERAIDVQSENAEAAVASVASMWQSHALLSSIAFSLRGDDADGVAPSSTPQ